MRIALHFLLFMFLSVHAIGQINLSVQTTPSTCQNNGSITVTATGGSGSYNYTLTSGPIGASLPQATSNIFYSLPSGNYTVEVTDNNGNINTMNAIVTGNYTNPLISTVVPSDGNMGYGTISVTVQNGTGLPPFQYAYTALGSPAPDSSAYQNSNLISYIPTGSYNIYIKDFCGNVNVYRTKVTFSYLIACFFWNALVGFKGIAEEKGNLLSWKTANENNNKGFYLQRSYDLLEWETFPALIKGKNQETNEYDTLDSDFNTQMNKVYYRLLQEDTDEKITYSDYISLWSIASNNILIYPNPASNTIFIENAMNEDLDGIVVYNESGEYVLYHGNITGSNKISVSIKDLTAGIYFMKITINGKSSFHKFVKED